jgi:signal transduction histidine kinase
LTALDVFLRTADLLPEPMLLVSLTGTIEATNAAFARMFGWPLSAVAAQPLSRFSKSVSPEFLDYLRRCAGTRQMLPGAVSLQHVDGTEIRCRCQGAVFSPSIDGKAAQVLLRVIPQEQASTRFIALSNKVKEMSIEVARRRTAEEAAASANRLKDEFLATLSHELRTPLNAILGWTQVAMRGDFAGERLQHALETILRNARAQSRMVDDLLEVSGTAKGKLSLQMQAVGMPDVVAAAVEAIQVTALTKGVALRVNIVEPVPEVVGDPQRLQQVAANLLSNAVKFTPPGGIVNVTLTRHDAEVWLVVSDTGEGIPANFLPEVFLRFRQGDSSTTRRHGGLGIGLALVKDLVELHGGRVRIESEGPGRGTSVTVSLPART